MEQEPGRRRRGTHSAEFKAEAVSACRKPGVSIAAAALERSMNANLLRRWVVEAERAEAAGVAVPRALAARGGKRCGCADPSGGDAAQPNPS